MDAEFMSGIGLIIGRAALLATSASAATPTIQGSFPIVELRQYTLYEGKRDVLIDLFEREFVETQEAQGMKVLGTFTDLDRPNRFVWIRGFKDMDSRLAGLSAFYGGPVWQAHREAANAKIIDSDNVLLLHAPSPAAEFKPGPLRPAIGEVVPSGLIVATICYLKSPPAKALAIFEAQVKPSLDAAGARPLAWFVPETAANNFQRLPVREGERVLVWFSGFASLTDHQAHQSAIDKAMRPIMPLLVRKPEILRLRPTARSQLRTGN